MLASLISYQFYVLFTIRAFTYGLYYIIMIKEVTKPDLELWSLQVEQSVEC